MIKTIVTWLLVLALGAAVIYGIVAGYEFWRDGKVAEGKTLGRAEIQKLWDDDRAQAQAAAIERDHQAAAETLRRLNKQKENDDAQAALLARVAADRDRARAAAGGLQLTASTYLDAAGCSGRSGDSALECVRAATAKVLDVFGRCASRVADLAAAADDARTRGLRCEADYDALTLKPTQPQGARP